MFCSRRMNPNTLDFPTRGLDLGADYPELPIHFILTPSVIKHLQNERLPMSLSDAVWLMLVMNISMLTPH